MTVMYMNLLTVYVTALFSRYFAKENELTQTKIIPNKLLALFALLSLVLVSGLRSNIGDTYYYVHSYTITDYTFQSIDFTGDFGFNLLQMLLQQISNDPQILLFVTALITNALIVGVLYHYSRMFELSLYVYITLGFFLVSMNGIRQYLAAAIIFAATKFLFEGSFKKYLLVVLLAATIHQSALVLIPIYFIVRKPAWSKMTFILLFCSIIIVAGFEMFLSVLFNVLGNTQYAGYQNFEEGGANILRVVVYATPVIIAFFGKEKLKEMFKHSDVVVNMSVIAMLFMIVSTQNWIFARFAIYFGLYQLLLIGWIVKLFIKKDQKLIYLGILVCYFIYFYYEQALSLNIIYQSNYFSF
ncbi:EpsG family protein [Alkalihalobacillus sp. LMS39]|uniref:EpsG family protein n=1 Tax=Alkalihalobacillus sp. LMS39 TaxID=2924032 RepID=UPI001FB2C09A|nr:EpsG family protein [Alkalihalobacillus sp. LMS39]UOE95436.1 EpsG family protein [Alkalihalobacillus sp. LMS39]